MTTYDDVEDESMTTGQVLAMAIAVLIFSGAAWVLQNGKRIGRAIAHACPFVWVHGRPCARAFRWIRKGGV